MYPTDVKEFAASRLVASLAKALHSGETLDLKAIYDELELQPTTLASYHAAAAAVHVLLAHDLGATHDDVGHERPAFALAGNGHSKKALAAVAPGRPSPSTTSKKTAHPCPTCGKKLTSPGMLARHMRQKHSTTTAPGAA